MKIYRTDELLRVAKRLNNSRRNYLLVNPLQGKHLPTSPAAALEMMNALGLMVAEKFPSARLVIGFAETATAIGAVVAKNLSDECFYLQTTRENLSGTCVEFLEEHSHAPQQRLFAANLAELLNKTREIIFVDDELSTGKTLLNVVRQLKLKFPALNGKKICAASIINRLSEENLANLAAENIFCVSLLKINQNFDAEQFHGEEAQKVPQNPAPQMIFVREIDFSTDPRRGVQIGDHFARISVLGNILLSEMRGIHGESGEILVLGTEEFMLPAIIVGNRLEKSFFVATHSTTRSPIEISADADYPIRSGYRLRSFYDATRTTFIYNLKRCDTAIILTDAENFSAGLQDLTAALDAEKIFCVRCRHV